MGSLYHGSMANRKAKTDQFRLNMRVSRAAKGQHCSRNACPIKDWRAEFYD